MYQFLRFVVFFILVFVQCKVNSNLSKMNSVNDNTSVSIQPLKQAYADVNGIKMYYEIYGAGKPLVMIHGGGSTIQTSFGRIIPHLSENRQLICVELQAHGRSGDRNTGISFEQDADDVAALIKFLGLERVDLLGFSNGGNSALQVGIRHPNLCNKIIAASVLLKRDGTFPQFWEFMKNGSFEQMPKVYKDAFLKVNPDSTKLFQMYLKCSDRMIHFKDFTDQEIASIQAPVLLINGDTDVASPEHIVAMSKLIPVCRVAIIPGGHGEYMGEISTLTPDSDVKPVIVPVMIKFLDQK